MGGSPAGALLHPPAQLCPGHDREACHSPPSLEGSTYWKCHRLFSFVPGTVWSPCTGFSLGPPPFGFYASFWEVVGHPAPTGLVWGGCCHISQSKKRRKTTCRNCWYVWKIQTHIFIFLFFSTWWRSSFLGAWVWGAFCSSREAH